MVKNSIMITAAMAGAHLAATALREHAETYKAKLDAIKASATKEMEALRDAHQEENAADWQRLEKELGLDPEINHSLCDEHYEAHDVFFVTEVEEEEASPAGFRVVAGGRGDLPPELARLLGAEG